MFSRRAPPRPLPDLKGGVLFLKPRRLYRSWPFSNDFMRHIFRAPSVAAPQLAGALKAAGLTVPAGFLDGVFAEGLSPEGYAEILRKPAVVGLSVVGPTMALDTELSVRLIREVNPGATIVMGGIHPTFYDREWLEKGADVVVRGEGERTFPELMCRIRDGGSLRDVPGLSYRENGRVVRNPDRPFVKRLDDLPMPDWSIVDFSPYDIHLLPQGASAAIETARGCPYRCTFCPATHMWRNTQRFKSAARILEEIDDLYGRGVRQLVIADDNFGARRGRDREVFRGIRDRGYELAFWSFLRADLAVKDPDYIRDAASAGLRFVLVGYESLNEAVLEKYRKHPEERMTAQDYARAYEVLKENGIFVYGLFVRDFDLGGEEGRTNWRMVRRVADISAQTRFIPMKGLPGSRLLEEQGYEIKDMFYHDRFWPAFSLGARGQRSSFARTEAFDLLRPENFRKLFRGSFVERSFFRNLYGGLLKDLLSLSPRGLAAFAITLHPGVSPVKKQERICNLYLSRDRGVSGWWKALRNLAGS